VNVGFISLGCAKNRVDTEIMIARVKAAGYKVVDKLTRAEIIIINTCGFIDEAKEEAITTIIQTGKLKDNGQLQYLLATGCLVQRYGQGLLDEMPELDGIVGISSFLAIEKALQLVQMGERVAWVSEPPRMFIEKGPRVLTTPAGSAYLKITEGCNNRCSYCAIPMIRGNLRSRPPLEIIQEARELVEKRGIKELVVIGQDTAVYGTDLPGQNDLPDLLKGLDAVDGLEWIRLMYVHPAHITDSLIEIVGSPNKIVPYLDMPIQHVSTGILKRMNRAHDYDYLDHLITRLRRQVDSLVLRTTVMLGFPGESNDDFQQLMDFIEAIEFDWLGAFVFNPEEDTPAMSMPNQVPAETKAERREAVMQSQNQITRRKNVQRIGRTERILLSGPAARNLYVGRAYFQAPEVDGITMVKSKAGLARGSMVDVKLAGIREYDMIGEPIDEYSE